MRARHISKIGKVVLFGARKKGRVGGPRREPGNCGGGYESGIYMIRMEGAVPIYERELWFLGAQKVGVSVMERDQGTREVVTRLGMCCG